MYMNPVYFAAMRYPRLLFLLPVPLALILGRCTLPPPPPPTAEFLVSAGDQTYWVRSDNSGLRIRGSPLILARTGGRYYEIFVSEIDRSFPKALFSGERVFRRELATGDSAVIYDDTTIVRMSDAYHQTHPNARLLRPDDDPDDDVDISAGGGGLVNRRWRHDGYDVVSHYDSAHKANTLALRDHRGREWRLGLIGSTYVQIFWLDRPRVDPQTRHALSRAFNDATTYGERIQQVSRRQHEKFPKRATSG